MHLAQQVSRRRVMPWLKPEQEEGERQYRAVALRFLEMGNSFLNKLAGAGLSELTRMPHALDPEKGFRVRSRFTFEDFIGIAQPPSPLRWLADIFLPFVGGRKAIANDAREFLRHLLEVNSARVQNDVLNRIQESRTVWRSRYASCCMKSAALQNRHLTGRGKSKKKERPPCSRQLNGSTDWNGMYRRSSNPFNADRPSQSCTAVGDCWWGPRVSRLN